MVYFLWKGALGAGGEFLLWFQVKLLIWKLSIVQNVFWLIVLEDYFESTINAGLGKERSLQDPTFLNDFSLQSNLIYENLEEEIIHLVGCVSEGKAYNFRSNILWNSREQIQKWASSTFYDILWAPVETWSPKWTWPSGISCQNRRPSGKEGWKGTGLATWKSLLVYHNCALIYKTDNFYRLKFITEVAKHLHIHLKSPLYCLRLWCKAERFCYLL